MKVLITAVGQRTEHWTDLFHVLAADPGVDVTVAVADVSPLTGLALRRTAADSRLRYHHLRHVMSEARSGHMASIMIAPGALRRAVDEPPDVIHIIGEAAYLSTWQVIRWRDRYWPQVPITQYAAQNIVMRFPAPFPWIEQRAYRTVDHFFPITPAALNVLRIKGYRGRASIVPLGVDTTLFTPPPQTTPETGAAAPILPAEPRPFTVGFVGRLETHKGIADLLESARRLDADLLIVGRGSLAPLIAAESERRPGRVTLRDWADHHELPDLMAQMDVLVLPSAEIVQRNVLPWVGIPLREQFGRVLVEAMACGIPVVGSEVGEIPHVIGPAGLVYPVGDIDALTERLARLRQDPALGRLLGRHGILRARIEFGWSGVAGAMRQVWEQLGSAGRSRPNRGTHVGNAAAQMSSISRRKKTVSGK